MRVTVPPAVLTAPVRPVIRRAVLACQPPRAQAVVGSANVAVLAEAKQHLVGVPDEQIAVGGVDIDVVARAPDGRLPQLPVASQDKARAAFEAKARASDDSNHYPPLHARHGGSENPPNR